MSVEWIRAQRDSASDDGLLIVRVLFDENSRVQCDSPLFEVEGSKSLFEVPAPVAGQAFSFVTEGDFVEIGEVLGCICTAGEGRPTKPTPSPDTAPATPASGERDRFSDSAWDLVQTRGLDPTQVRTDLDFVTAADVGTDVLPQTSAPLSTPKGVTRIALLGGSYGATLAFDACIGRSDLGIVGVFDDRGNQLDAAGIPLLGNLQTDFVAGFEEGHFDAVLIVVQADMKARVKLHEQCQDNSIPLATVVHPKANVSTLATLGLGCLVLDSSRIGPYAVIEDNVFVSGSVNIDHHCHIGSDSTFGPGVFLSGGVRVGRRSNFGTAIGVESHVAIGQNCTITSGSVIQKDIPDNTIAKVTTQVTLRSRW